MSLLWNKLKSLKVAKSKDNDGGAGGIMDFMMFTGFNDRWTDRQTDIGESWVAFASENLF